jgi:hypothetical protein
MDDSALCRTSEVKALSAMQPRPFHCWEIDDRDPPVAAELLRRCDKKHLLLQQILHKLVHLFSSGLLYLRTLVVWLTIVLFGMFKTTILNWYLYTIVFNLI